MAGKTAKTLNKTAMGCAALGVVVSAGCAHLTPVQERAPERPNIILIFTDDQGWADMGANGVRTDVKTPHLDELANDGVRFTDGYITAPQCAPSRAGLMTGRYQTRYDFEHIAKGPLPFDEVTVADRLREAGYVTGMVGKWHLEPNHTNVDWAREAMPEYTGEGRPPVTFAHTVPYRPDSRGFDYVCNGELYAYWSNYFFPEGSGKESGVLAEPELVRFEPGYRLDIQSDAAVSFIEAVAGDDDPFFLYLAYYAPHVPLEATEEYLSRFPDPDMHERRRYGLAMISAMDDGIGRIRESLRARGLEDDTLIIYTSDNGAPLLEHTRDFPIERPGGAWDGSLNDPWLGEKGMLMEGGIRVPFVMHWANGLPSGEVFSEPVSALDIMPSLLGLAGVEVTAADRLDGVDIIPAVRGEEELAERALFWRFWGQAAVRRGDWKLLALGTGERLLFDLSSPGHESLNVADMYPALSEALEAELSLWADEQVPPGVPNQPLNHQEIVWYKQHAGLELE